MDFEREGRGFTIHRGNYESLSSDKFSGQMAKLSNQNLFRWPKMAIHFHVDWTKFIVFLVGKIVPYDTDNSVTLFCHFSVNRVCILH